MSRRAKRGELIAAIETMGKRDGPPRARLRSVSPRVADPDLPRCPRSGKTSFVSEDAALSRAMEWAEQNSWHAVGNAYDCPDCEFWHLTSQRSPA